MTKRLGLAAGCLLLSSACSEEIDDEGVDSAETALNATTKGTVRSMGGCLDAERAANGTRVQLWRCDGSTEQRWVLSGDRLVGKNGRCLAVEGASRSDGARIVVEDCRGGAHQTWTRRGAAIVGLGGKCLDVANAGTANGTPVVLWSCHGRANQQWALDGATTGTPAPAPPGERETRDVRAWPFAADSIWNTPIGSGARFGPTNFSDVPGGDVWAPMPHIDEEYIALTPQAPLTPIYYSDASWDADKNRCVAFSPRRLLTTVPMPADFLVAHSNENAGAAFLMPDGKTIHQMQPLARCSAGGYGTSLLTFAPVDIYGDGRLGAHGGSGLSSIGGSLRVGELRPGGQPPRHALKVNVYSREELSPCATMKDCYVWPARTGDGHAFGRYGKAGKPSPAMRMGALLAIPSSTAVASLGLETSPAKMLAWTLQNYGAYVVDDTWAPAFHFSASREPTGSFTAQFEKDWGFKVTQRVRDGSPWVRDVQRLRRALRVVTNNTPSTVGGGGTRLQPPAPPFR